MEGITILSTWEACRYPICQIFIGFSVFLGTYGFFSLKIKQTKKGIVAFALAVVCSSFSIFLATKTETRIKATVSDNVKFKEITEKYKVIDQDGDIYTLVERQ